MIQKTLIALAFASIAGLSAAQQTNFYSDGRPERLFYPSSGLDHQDISFLRNAEVANEFEIESSKIALQNGSSDFIKQFAKDMITDHTAAKTEVEQVSSEKSLAVGAKLPPPLQSKLNKLRNLQGDAFDNAFRAAQKLGHEQAINLFKGEIEHGHDQDVKAVAVKLLPTIEMHYNMLLNGKTETGDTAANHGL